MRKVTPMLSRHGRNRRIDPRNTTARNRSYVRLSRLFETTLKVSGQTALVIGTRRLRS